MEHAEVLRSQAIEKYLLGGLHGQEREQFEAHMFECGLCAEEIRAGVFLMDNAAAEFKSRAAAPQRTPEKARWLDWFRLEWSPAFAASLLALVVVSGFWLRDRSRLRSELDLAGQPQAASGIIVENARGEDASAVSRYGNYVVVSFFTDPGEKYPVYSVDISGNEVARATVSVPVPALGRPCAVLLPASRYKAGEYQFEVRGGSGPAAPVLKTFTLNLK